MKRIIIFLSLVLVACQPSAEAIEKAIAETQSALPTETIVPIPTPISFSDLDLSHILFLEGELPTGYSPGQIRSEGAPETKKLNEVSVNEFHQDLSFLGKEGGRVSIFLFDTLEESNSAYTLLEDQMRNSTPPTNEIEDLGDEGIGQVYNFGIVDASLISFRRCTAVVFVNTKSSQPYKGLIDYSKLLDKRITKTICP